MPYLNISLSFFQLEAEELPELSEKYEIAAVPTFIFLKVGQDSVEGHGIVVRVLGLRL